MTYSLKACPFCGNQQLTDDEAGETVEYIEQWRVCDVCGCEARYWNTRPIEDALRTEIERLRATRDAEVQQFNDGYQAYTDGAGIDCSPWYDNDTDQWRIGWVWAQYNAVGTERELTTALDEIISYIPTTIIDNSGNPKVSLYCVHKLQDIARAARSTQKESN